MTKVSKASVNYRPAVAGQTVVTCAGCSMFLPRTGSCTLVAGRIDPDAVCDRWTPR